MGLFDKLRKQNAENATGLVIPGKCLVRNGDNLMELSEAILLDTRTELTEENSISVPLGELAALGGAVAALIPAFRTVTETTTISANGLYRLANEATGDALKVAKNGNFWGAFKKADGGSKFVQLAKAEPLSATTKTVLPLDPATMMMAVALYSVEKQLGEITEMEKQILSFLEQEKESEIEGDLKTLTYIIQNYKYNWDKEQFISGNYKLTMDIRRTAEKNLRFSRKQIAEAKKTTILPMANQVVKTAEKSLEKKFKYYRLTLYVYALASFVEVMLLGNFQEEYILQTKATIEKYSEEYTQSYLESAAYIDKISGTAIEANAINALGTAGAALGNLLGKVPVLKEGPVDEWLMDSGDRLKQAGEDMKKKSALKFEVVSDAGTELFVTRFDEMNQIYNHTDAICFDAEKLYLVGQ